jgi:hypothetical protein
VGSGGLRSRGQITRLGRQPRSAWSTEFGSHGLSTKPSPTAARSRRARSSRYREIEKDDRAALIKIGEKEDFAIKFLRTTNLISPETIWDAIESLLASSDHPKTADFSSQPAENGSTTSARPG